MIKNSVELQKVISLGFALVPSNTWNKEFKPKKPYWEWKQMTKAFNAIELFDKLDAGCSLGENGEKIQGNDTVAVVAGAISGGLVIVDVDTKFKPGFGSTLFKELKEYHSNIYEKIRIEKTPSGGYHIYYRVVETETVFGNGGLKFGSIASCFMEDVNGKIEHEGVIGKWQGFIEIKNICQCYPSPGYEIKKEGLDFFEKVSILSLDEHYELIQLLYGYDETEEIKKTYVKPKKEDFDYYEEDPWESFNKGYLKHLVLSEYFGWTLRKKNDEKIYFSRPNHKTKGDDAVYRFENNRYKVYTTSAELEEGSYSPVVVLLTLKFGGNKSECFKWLVREGYGKIKSAKEQYLLKRAINRNENLETLISEIPNLSEKAKEDYVKIKSERDIKYPFGVFWEIGDKKEISVNRERLYRISKDLGFRVNGQDLCYIGIEKKEYVISVVEPRFYFDKIKEYMGECTDDEKSCCESFIQKSGSFTITRLEILDLNLVLESNKFISYKFFNNGYLSITASEVNFLEYTGLEKLVWKHNIQNRDYIGFETGILNIEEVVKNGVYRKFLELAISGGISQHLLRCIGYYAHDYKSTMTPYIVILCEAFDKEHGGGSGKNVFTNLFNFTSSVLNKPANNVKFDDTLLRTRKTQKILSLNDAEKKFNYMGLRELSSGEGEVGKKFMQEITIANKDMPKFIVNTNFSFDPSQPGLKRRMVPVEFTDFFTSEKNGGVDTYFKKEFPSEKNSEHDWNESDWISFDYTIIKSIQEFLNYGCRLSIPELTDGGWTKQFEQRFSEHTFLFIRENINQWLELEEVEINKVFNMQYNAFILENKIDRRYELSSIKMNAALKEYCNHFNIEFIPCKNLGKINYVQTNAKVFKRIGGVEKINKYIENEEIPF